MLQRCLFNFLQSNEACSKRGYSYLGALSKVYGRLISFLKSKFQYSAGIPTSLRKKIADFLRIAPNNTIVIYLGCSSIYKGKPRLDFRGIKGKIKLIGWMESSYPIKSR